MATNKFFQNSVDEVEANLIDDLTVEMIQIYGVDTYYVTRKSSNFDRIKNEDRLTIFDDAYQIEMYVDTFDGFGGEGDFLSKFGLQVRDQITLSCAIRTFDKQVLVHKPSILRPREGDIVYFPMADEFFKIMQVEHEVVFYQLGRLQVYQLKCELIEYSNERFETGIEMIDKHFQPYRTDQVETLEQLQEIDVIANNLVYNDVAEDFVDFDEFDPFQDRIVSPPSRD